MSNKIQFGATSWESDVQVPQGNKSNKDLFLRLESGSNVLRLVTKPYEYLVHRYKVAETDPGFGERVMSSIFHGSDPLVDMGFKPKRRWLAGVIDRKTQSYKVLDMSTAVFKSVQKYVRDEDWGDPSQYDVDIVVDKQGGATGYYSVVAKPMKPLSPEDLEIKADVDLEDLKRRCTPPTPEQVQTRIDAIKAKRDGVNGVSTSTPKNVDMSGSDNADFPPV